MLADSQVGKPYIILPSSWTVSADSRSVVGAKPPPDTSWLSIDYPSLASEPKIVRPNEDPVVIGLAAGASLFAIFFGTCMTLRFVAHLEIWSVAAVCSALLAALFTGATIAVNR